MVRTKWGVLAYCLLWAWLPARAQQGYDIIDNRIVVAGRSHWEHWKKPEHLTAIDSEGERYGRGICARSTTSSLIPVLPGRS